MSRTFRRSAEEQFRRQAQESRFISPSRRAKFKRSIREELIASLLYDDDDTSPSPDFVNPDTYGREHANL